MEGTYKTLRYSNATYGEKSVYPLWAACSLPAAECLLLTH